MMQFNSPKNFKRGRLIANKYRPVDLVFASVTIAVTLLAVMIYLLAMSGTNLVIFVLLCMPAVFGVCLLIPFEIYHNPIETIKLWRVYQKRNKKWIWEGIYKNDVLEEKTEEDDLL